MANDIFSTLRVYLSKLTEGEHTPAEVLASVNTWLRESGESIKAKIEEEVERAVAKRGFVKQADFDQLKKEVDALRSATKEPKKVVAKKAVTKKVAATKPKTVKKTAAKGAKK
jgi:hypothetical protein